ncbi:MAG: DUF72 domain-containing protein [Chitinophagaceae bacterium]|nr:DUF72 domain-containing protein [Chitinophagaceae bacterium]
MKKGEVRIGTSGWHYKHWKNTFYPNELPEKQQFPFYATRFNTVEINNSFYKLPAEDVFRQWRKDSPRDFLFVIKASRFITHMKKLNLDKDGIRLFFSRVKLLKEKLGPILFQLPPRWKFNPERLAHFLSILPSKYRYAFEFRDKSWYRNETYELLRKNDCAFCIYELAGHQSPMEVTASFVYIRLHGPSLSKYQGNYSKQQLTMWKKKCAAWQKEGKDVYMYFDNDQAGYAAFNAATLIDLLK